MEKVRGLLQRLMEAISGYDFESAYEIVNELLSELKNFFKGNDEEFAQAKEMLSQLQQSIASHDVKGAQQSADDFRRLLKPLMKNTLPGTAEKKEMSCPDPQVHRGITIRGWAAAVFWLVVIGGPFVLGMVIGSYFGKDPSEAVSQISVSQISNQPVELDPKTCSEFWCGPEYKYFVSMEDLGVYLGTYLPTLSGWLVVSYKDSTEQCSVHGKRAYSVMLRINDIVTRWVNVSKELFEEIKIGDKIPLKKKERKEY
jgi:hypothetical protein